MRASVRPIARMNRATGPGWRLADGLGAVRGTERDEAPRDWADRVEPLRLPPWELRGALDVRARAGDLVAMPRGYRGRGLPEAVPDSAGVRVVLVATPAQMPTPGRAGQTSTTTGTIIGRRRCVELTQRPT